MTWNQIVSFWLNKFTILLGTGFGTEERIKD